MTNQCTVRYLSRCVAWAWDWVVWVAIVQVTGQCIIVRYRAEWPSHQSDWISVEGINFSNKGNTNTKLPPQSFNNNQQFNTQRFGCIHHFRSRNSTFLYFQSIKHMQSHPFRIYKQMCLVDLLCLDLCVCVRACCTRVYVCVWSARVRVYMYVCVHNSIIICPFK